MNHNISFIVLSPTFRFELFSANTSFPSISFMLVLVPPLDYKLSRAGPMFHTSVYQFLSVSPKLFIKCVANGPDLEEKNRVVIVSSYSRNCSDYPWIIIHLVSQ